MKGAQYTAWVPISMKIFADSATAFIAERPDAATRQRAWAAFEAAGLPTTNDEVWRYAPLKDFVLDRFDVPGEPTTRSDSAFAAQLCERAGLVVRVVDGFCVSTGAALEGVEVAVVESSQSLAGPSFIERYESDTFAVLNAALTPATTVIRVGAGVNVEEPIVVLNVSNSTATLGAMLVTRSPPKPPIAVGPAFCSTNTIPSGPAPCPSHPATGSCAKGAPLPDVRNWKLVWKPVTFTGLPP